MSWEGRGRGRRDEILARLNGRGAARAPGPAGLPAPPPAVPLLVIPGPPPVLTGPDPAPPDTASAVPRVSFAPRAASASPGSAAPGPAPAGSRAGPRARSAPSRARHRRRSPAVGSGADGVAAIEAARLLDRSLVVLDVPYLRHNVQASDGQWWLAVGFPSATIIGARGPLGVIYAPRDSHVTLCHLPAGLSPEQVARVLGVLRPALAAWADPLPLTENSVSRWAGRVSYVPRPTRPGGAPLLLIADASPLYASVQALAADAFAAIEQPPDAPGSRTDYHLRLGIR